MVCFLEMTMTNKPELSETFKQILIAKARAEKRRKIKEALKREIEELKTLKQKGKNDPN